MSTQEYFDRAKYDPAALGKVLLGDDLQLYPHQYSTLSSMGPALYEGTDYAPNTAIMSPSGQGLTTIMVIMAVWHGLFSPGKTALFLVKDAAAVKEFKERMLTSLKKLQAVRLISYSMLDQLPGKVVVKTATITNIKATKGESLAAVYIDTPAEFTDSSDMAKAATTIAATAGHDTKPRFHLLTSGYNAAIAQIIKTGFLRGIPFVGTRIPCRVIYSEQHLDQLFTQLGEKEFLLKIACTDPSDPNAFARFLRGEL